MKNINDNCNRCGKCCEAIWMPLSMNEVKKGSSPDVPFLLKNWVPITEEEAKKMNPYIVDRNRDYIDNNYYKCLAYDKANKLCTVHKNRPDVCRNYPFYPHQDFVKVNGAKKLDKNYNLYSPNCAFQKFKLTGNELTDSISDNDIISK